MTDTLLPCPFCGGAPTEYDQIGYSSVKCRACNFSIKVKSPDGPPYAPELWNTRAPAQPAQVQGWQMVPVEPTPEMVKLSYDIIAAEGVRLSEWLLRTTYKAVLAASPKPPVQEPVAWMLADAVGGSMMEFQRELLLEFQCRYGGEIVPLYTAPQPSDDAKDAARHRWLRDNWFTMRASYHDNNIKFYTTENRYTDYTVEQLDAAIDAAIAGGGV